MKRRIVVLGGGAGALSAVWELTNRPGWKDRFDITVLQMGHRLGGKGASGVNHAQHDRIEEHGLHLFWGFYENAFRLMREAYDELARPVGTPLARLEDAFFPHDVITLADYADDGKVSFWPLHLPRNQRRPGDGLDDVLEPFDVVPTLIGQALEALGVSADDDGEALTRERSWLDRIRPLLESALSRGADAFEQVESALAGLARTVFASVIRARQVTGEFLSLVGGLAVLRGLNAAGERGNPERTRSTLFLVRHLQASLARLIESGEKDARLHSQIDLGLCLVRGLVVDGLLVPPRDFHALDHESLRAWFRRHGAREETLRSPLLEGLHCAIYASGIDVGAGTGVHGILRLTCTYKGSILWKMRAGMGETIFAPLYEALRHRGVKFKFFHSVDGLELSADRRRIARIRVDVQARCPESYEPLVNVKGLPVWPSEPRWEQLEGGRSGVDFENWWSGAEPVERVVLHDGRDFDEVILGISLGALNDVCAELVRDERNPRFAAMVKGVATTLTQSSQVWLRPTVTELGWVGGTGPGEAPVVVPYRACIDTWADMPHLLARETWPEHQRPGSCAYLTGRLEDGEPVPPKGRSDYPERIRARVRANTERWLTESARPLWPKAADANDPNAVKWHWLCDPLDRVGPARLDAQWVAPVSNPSNRYVLTLPGTTQYRLRSNESGYDNLVLAGDWTRNAINGGCFEGAVMSGLDAARALDPGVREGIGDWLGRLERAQGVSGAKSSPVATSAERVPLERTPVSGPGPTWVEPGGRRLPKYALRDGELLAVPPIRLEVDVTLFVMRADPARLTELLDAQLNLRPDQVVYRPMAPLAVLYCARVDNYAVTDPLGFVPELDFGWWVPALAGRMQGGRFTPERAVTFTPYLWVSNDVALTNGRSVFGFAKDLGTQFSMPDAAAPERPYSVDAWVMPRLGPNAPTEQRRLFEVTHAPVPSVFGTTKRVANVLGVLTSALTNRPDDEAFGSSFRAALSLWQAMPKGQRMVFLKQLPDVIDTRRACYQAVLETDIAFEQAPQLELLDGPASVTLWEYDSHHVARTLGLAGEAVEGRKHVAKALLSARARFSAKLEHPTIVWERGVGGL